MTSAVIKFSVALLVIGVCLADVSYLPQVNQPLVTEACLDCICQAVSGCKLGTQCEGDLCGLFKITWAYWSDAGKPTINGMSPDAPDAYQSCAKDRRCATSAVQNYMAKFGQDCNGDGVVNCYDYMAIHKLGGYGCTAYLPQVNQPLVTEACLDCICQAVSGCKLGTQCEGDLCGLFKITWAYWSDAGKPTINGMSPDAPDAYQSCAKDRRCATSAVQNYMAKFGQDCNGDGVVNCYDYMAIHKLGGYGCTAYLPQVNQPLVTEACLDCICQAVSGCKLGTQCEGDLCGLFKITWAYWSDAGKPTINGMSPDSPDAYRSCAKDRRCATSAVQNYMAKFGQDCNGDGVVNCYDYMAIHKLGGYGCTGYLDQNYVNVFNKCVAPAVARLG